MAIPERLKPYFTAITILSVGVILGDILLSAQFGFGISVEVGIIASMISLGSGILLVIAAFYWYAGAKPLAYLLIAVWTPLFIFNIFSNMGVATANRMENVQRASLQQARFEEVRNSKREAKVELDLLNNMLPQLRKNFSDLTQTNVNGWTVTSVPAETATLDRLVAEKKAERDREKGRGGCGSKCEARTAELNHLVALRGVAAEIENAQKRIEATEAGLNKRRQQLAETDAGLSKTASQAELYVKIASFVTGNGWNASEEPDMLNVANEGMGVFMAFSLALASAGLSVAGVWPHLMETRGSLSGMNAPLAKSEPIEKPAAPSVQIAADMPKIVTDRQPTRPVPVTTVGALNIESLRRIVNT